MTPTQIKICGINSAQAFDAVVDAAADYLGFVFFQRSPRFVTPAQAAKLTNRHPGGPKRVGLLVEPEPSEIAAVLETLNLDILQIYGSAALCQDIRARFGLPVWRAIGITTKADLPSDAQSLDGFVIESKPPAGASRPGGNAAKLDWGMFESWKAPSFWLLAGGLKPENARQAISQSNAPAVDVSSGVETAPGQKSAALIRDFCASVREAT